jgi:hypothetical protein
MATRSPLAAGGERARAAVMKLGVGSLHAVEDQRGAVK